MNTDQHGCSTCKKGAENYEPFTTRGSGRQYIQYDFRTESGLLFSTVGNTLTHCREKRNNWLKGLQN